MAKGFKRVKNVLPFATKKRLHQEKGLSNSYLENNRVLARERSQLYEELGKKGGTTTFCQEDNVVITTNLNGTNNIEPTQNVNKPVEQGTSSKLDTSSKKK